MPPMMNSQPGKDFYVEQPFPFTLNRCCSAAQRPSFGG
jgi:hypothetical protein